MIGWRAYGDWLYASPSLPQLFEKYDVHLETNTKGKDLFYDDPRFLSKSYFEVGRYPKEKQLQAAEERWAELERQIKPDKTINLWQSLEVECICERFMPDFYNAKRSRRKKYGSRSFYDAAFDKCECEYKGNVEGLWYSSAQLKWLEEFKNYNKDNFTVFIAVAGSCAHKIYPETSQLLLDILSLYPKSKIYLMGGPDALEFPLIDNDRIVNCINKYPMKQSILLTRGANFVFGGETGLVVGAGMWGTPKIMLCTASSVYQCCKYQENDFSVQADIKCSPCHRAIYNDIDCDKLIYEDDGSCYPACVDHFGHEYILKTIGDQYTKWNA